MIVYKAPNKKHFAIDVIKFTKEKNKPIALLIQSNSGLTLKCTSKKFVEYASSLATKYYTKQ